MSRPVVSIKQGSLRGTEAKSEVGGTYISFKGIPYATPPIGDLRFRDPQPPQPWSGVRDALTSGSKSAQTAPPPQKFIGDDDCLYLDVATTSLTGSRPVMVWIHGGGFLSGSGDSDMYGPDYIVGSEVVVVTINYRLGVLGFLHLDHEVAPGNAGLKDQVAALKWVRENIAQFGGDPNNVTVFGESAGGSSVHYLLLSPLAKGLFHKGIMQSGVVLNPFAITSTSIDTARRYVAILGKDLTEPKEIVEYLRTVPISRLIEAQDNLLTLEERINLLFPFGPFVDNKSTEPFMPKPVEELVEQGFDIPVIIGHTSDEGVYFLTTHGDEEYKKLDENFETAMPRDFAAKNPSKIPEIARELRKFYFGDKRITKDVANEFAQCYGDIHFVEGIHKVVEIQREKKSPTYLYRFSYDSPNSIAKKVVFSVEAKGVMHTDDLHYLFFAHKFGDQIKTTFGPKDKVVRDRMVRMWTDFAKTGNPTPVIDDLITEKWEPITKTTKNYLEIGAELSSGVDPVKDVWETWKRIYAIVDDQ